MDQLLTWRNQSSTDPAKVALLITRTGAITIHPVALSSLVDGTNVCHPDPDDAVAVHLHAQLTANLLGLANGTLSFVDGVFVTV